MNFQKAVRADAVTWPEQALVGWAVVDPLPLGIKDRDETIETFGDHPEEVFLIAQTLFRILARRDVGHGDMDNKIFGLTPDSQAIKTQINQVEIISDQPELRLAITALAHQRLEELAPAFAVFAADKG